VFRSILLVLLVTRPTEVNSQHAAPATTHTTASLALVFATTFLVALGDDPRGALTRDREARRDGRETERLADEVA
jgi:hypothetical protein